jgi:hypothetical protein
MGKVSKGYILKKGSIRWHLKGFSGVRALFSPGISNKSTKRIALEENNGISGSQWIDSSVVLIIINLT